MDKNRFRIGLLAVILLVVFRIAIGWHFLYEGILKFDPLHEFSAKGFLGMAKGPTAPIFYEMLPDIDGRDRLKIEPVKNADGKDTKLRTFPVYENAWAAFKSRFDSRYALDEAQKAEARRIYDQYLASLREYAADVETDVAQFLGSMARFDETAGENQAAYQQQRDWDAMMKYRADGAKWTGDLDKMGDAMAGDLLALYNPRLAGMTGQIVTRPEKPWVPNPIADTQMSLLNRSVMLGLTAIGICMILGFCNRLACLGGATFLFNVWLSQFPWPGVYPPIPDMIGHFLIVTKDFVELLGCLILAALPAGRWGGLDFFLYHNCGGKKLAQWIGLEDVAESDNTTKTPA
ncbi:MAG TPA: hypothetical protein DEB39_16640 [Planctomycetaceae bacterium]|nr:hypothetical protein [Planctomycetaceae bacterium]